MKSRARAWWRDTSKITCFDMDLSKALGRISWRMRHTKPFTPNQEDRDAFNAIVDYVSVMHVPQPKLNELFFKLAIKYYTELARHYQDTPMGHVAQKEFFRVLNSDKEALLMELVDVLNNNEVYQLMDQAGYSKTDWINKEAVESFISSLGYTDTQTMEKVQQRAGKQAQTGGRMVDLLEKNQEVKEFVLFGKKIWSREQIAQHVNKMVGHAANNFIIKQ